MRKILLNFIIIFILLIGFAVIFLSTKGVETNKFSSIINKKVNEFDKNLISNVDKVKIKLDFKKLNFFLQIKNIEINYFNSIIPLKEIRANIPFDSIIGKNKRIEKIFLSSDELNIKEFKKFIVNVKPSNFKSFVLNNIQSGKIKSNLGILFSEKMKILDYELDGYVRDLEGKAGSFEVLNTNFIYFIKNDNGSLSDITTDINGIPINSGQIKFEKKKEINLQLNFQTNLSLNEKQIKKAFINLKNDFLKNPLKVETKLKHSFEAIFDKNFKIKDYKYEIKGEIENGNVKFFKPLKNPILTNDILKISLKDSKITFIQKFNKDKTILLEGKQSINQNNFEKYVIQIIEKNKKKFIDLDFDLSETLQIPIINYKKENKEPSNIKTKIVIDNKTYLIDQFLFKANKSKIGIKKLKLQNDLSFKNVQKLDIKTTDQKNKINNEFSIEIGKNIEIKGKKYDATNLIKLFNKDEKENSFKNLNKKIQINFDQISNSYDPIYKFNLIGEIKKGQFVKISSKGEFSEGKYLDISLQKDKKGKKKYIEIYSDHPKFLLSQNKFFNGLVDGKLLFTSVYDDNESLSNLSLEEFKVANAPGFVKLLSLADLGGMADMVSGEGLSFDKMELKLNTNKDLLKINELYAIGPSISILMDGFVDKKTKLVSLRGTMIPAKNLNKILSKIPVVGEILIPKEVGEGLFGVSFKMKGAPGKIKTTVNPIRSITPRFIQRALGKGKN